MRRGRGGKGRGWEEDGNGFCAKYCGSTALLGCWFLNLLSSHVYIV